MKWKRMGDICKTFHLFCFRYCVVISTIPERKKARGQWNKGDWCCGCPHWAADHEELPEGAAGLDQRGLGGHRPSQDVPRGQVSHGVSWERSQNYEVIKLEVVPDVHEFVDETSVAEEATVKICLKILPIWSSSTLVVNETQDEINILVRVLTRRKSRC